MKEISVIVPCYNVEEYLDACLESLVSQTLGLERMELILVDDASQDATLEHLRAWEREYPEQILVVECAENGRQGTARNIGMQYATGEYIGFVDSDDWVEPDMYEVLLERGREHGCEIVSCHAFRNKEDGRQVPEPTEREDSLIRRERSAIQGGDWPEMLEGGIWSKIYRRDFLVENGIFFPEGLCYEDNYFGMMAALYCRSIYKVQRCLYHYRENQTSTTLQRNNDRLFDRLDIEVMKLEKLRELGLAERFSKEIERSFFEMYYFNTMYMMATRFDAPPYEMFQRMEREIFELFPNYRENRELMDSGNGVWDLLLKVLSCHFSEEQFRDFMRKYAALPRA